MIGRTLAWTVIAALLLGGAANAQTLHSVSEIVWETKPTGKDMANYYPEKAQRAGLSGWSVIECLTETTGALKNCQVLGEAPEGFYFGAAGLALSKLFKVDTSKVPPDTLASGVVAFPIVMTMNGQPVPLRNTHPGGVSVLLSPSAKGATPCPTPAAPQQTCDSHRLKWTAEPSLVEAASFIRAAASTPTSTAVMCPIDADMKLKGCKLAGAADPSQIKAMNSLLPLFTAPTEAEDKTPAKDGFVLIQFDWRALQRAVNTSVLTRLP